jgi:hypothetical protein
MWSKLSPKDLDELRSTEAGRRALEKIEILRSACHAAEKLLNRPIWDFGEMVAARQDLRERKRRRALMIALRELAFAGFDKPGHSHGLPKMLREKNLECDDDGYWRRAADGLRDAWMEIDAAMRLSR